MRLLIIVALLSLPAAAETLVVPMEAPPPVERQAERSVRLWGGYAGAHGPGLSMDGGASGWDYSENKGDWRYHIHAVGLVLKGTADFKGSGRSGASLGGGVFGGGVSKDLGPVTGRAGAAAHMQSVTVDRTNLHAVSILLGFPLSVEATARSGDWSATGALTAALYGAGAQFYTRGRPSEKLDPFFGGGACAAVIYEPWRLSLEGGFQALSGSGNAREALLSRLGLAWRWQ